MGDLPEDFEATLEKRMKAAVFVPLDPDEDIGERCGWASLTDPFDLELGHDAIAFNEYLAFSFRMDRWAVPSPLLKAHLREAEQKLLEKKGLEKLGRKAKADLKLLVTKKLRHRLVPVTKSVELVWHLNRKQVLFTSQQKKAIELVSELFEKTFRVQLLIESPGTKSLMLPLHPEEEKTFAVLEPTELFEGGAS